MRMLISWHDYVQYCYEVYTYVKQWPTMEYKMSLGDSMFQIIFAIGCSKISMQRCKRCLQRVIIPGIFLVMH